MDKSIKPNTLLLGDKNAILTAARIDAYGSDYSVNITCPQCSEISETVVDLSSFKPKATQATEDAEVNDKGNLILKLPRSGALVEVRFLTTHDEEIINKFAKKNKKVGIEKMITLQYKQMIISINGSESILNISRFIDSMPAFDSKYLRTTYQELAPDMDLNFDFGCPHCDTDQQMEVPITVGFFWPK